MKRADSPSLPRAWRRRLVLAVWLLSAAAICMRAAQIQIVQGAEWRGVAEDQHKKDIVVAAARGAILDRDGELPKTYPYPLQVWRFGPELTLIAMGGEVVVDYVLRLNRELDADKIWVAGFSNDVLGYIPSARILAEGGAEAETIYYDLPAPFAPSIEETIVAKVHQWIAQTR